LLFICHSYMKQSLILLAIHDPAFAREAKATLEANGYRTESASTGSEILAKVQELHPKVLLSDLAEPPTELLDLVRSTEAQEQGTTLLVALAEGQNDLVQAALEAGAYDWIPLPLKPGHLVPAVRRSIERQDLLNELTSLRRALDGTHGCVLGMSETGISLEGVERELLVRALTKFSGNQTRAAKYLDISRRTLIYRMEKFGLRRREQEAPASVVTDAN
jgi:DNA-binding NtrC family response regulator